MDAGLHPQAFDGQKELQQVHDLQHHYLVPLDDFLGPHSSYMHNVFFVSAKFISKV